MNRWKCKTSYGDILIYADTKESAQQFVSEATDIEPYTDMSYMQYINEIKSQSEFIGYDRRFNRNGEVYKYPHNGKYILVKLYAKDGEYYDYCEFQRWDCTGCVAPITWTLSDPTKFCEMYLTSPVKYERYSYRQYGQPKLLKPIELKGVKQSFSGEYILKKCNCPCFCVGNDLWIQHRDFFSGSLQAPDEEIGAPLEYLVKKYCGKTKAAKFIYPDAWGDIVLRDEAWIVFRNIKQEFQRELSECANENYVAHEIARVMLDEFLKNDSIAYKHLHNYISFELQWERFFEDVCKKYEKWLKENRNDIKE